MSEAIPDSIEKTVVLRAPPGRVWRALASADEFGSWFGVRLEGPFVEGQTVRGHALHPGYEHVSFDMMIVRIEPERYFAYRWHPYAVDMSVDYSGEPTTLVEFRLEASGEDTVLTLVESGFDRIPQGRRADAFRMNEGGWTGQMKNIAGHV
ncbi:MAG: SRPBCC family protein, partial [Acidobacteriota bacterium]|nr:SRPBCC family protein [Acidobacteriota bacterium]